MLPPHNPQPITMPYPPSLRLMRLHQPIGIWLLLWPCWWAAALASGGRPSLVLLILFALGAVVMRSAGCIVNDMADREFDRQVERTRGRPLASGEMSMKQAGILLFLLLIVAALDALCLGKTVFFWAMASLPLVAAYPFMKRFTWWPQLFLGLTFNWGALLGWVAVRGQVELPALLIYAGGVFWTLGYDTIYAHQDKIDDARVGIKSSALRLGAGTKKAVGMFYVLAVMLWALAGWANGSTMLLFAALILAELQFAWQCCTVNLDDPASARRIFVSNAYVGGVVFLAFFF